jgi:hypothetical protein
MIAVSPTNLKVDCAIGVSHGEHSSRRPGSSEDAAFAGFRASRTRDRRDGDAQVLTQRDEFTRTILALHLRPAISYIITNYKAIMME